MLSSWEQLALEQLGRDPDCYGVLRPREDGNLTVKALTPETALLLHTLQSPSTLPRYALNPRTGYSDAAIARLVLDGVLEIEDDGKMFSGPQARRVLFGADAPRECQSRLAALSSEALEYAATLRMRDAGALSTRLYTFNRVPASQWWRRTIADAGGVAAYLGLNEAESASALNRMWARAPSPGASTFWISWDSLRASYADGGVTYKLYVSPSSDKLREAFLPIVKAVAKSGAFHFKVGHDVYGILRPDKMVAYFRDFTELQAAAVELLAELSGCPSHGVPFTAELGADGLISWGIDPPSQGIFEPWVGRESWRGRICNLLAGALVLAQSSGQGESCATRFALDRIRLEGIDTDTWAPQAQFVWRD